MQREVVMAGGFADRLKAIRKRAKMTQEGLARAANLSLSTIAKLEQGEGDPTWNTVRALARALSVSVAEFDFEEPEAEPMEESPAPKKPKGKK
ncbi:xre family transcriptional regulator : Helix-turn-helix domain protein OS=Streptomyces albulus GN=DC74_2630 PE=4 SV=1: HTH_31 [Gemmata massiliana]|uniref:HTH cro/C1-type domain-containing protein n=1 Tax=Gemmata massiliana TaxID=1210884 RepID=A0A6P2CT01_9BACT|nr:helix-turn-helix transcriptional regulator [Gemmata massiliana]VTR90834.1 xre family transcriptional regulator : Helix-turn-helix domain protein OS=Streptomyces albulus GN=DC74_2630 PE=4 SV=1: HTH_31 [Gemmata massiliana]